MAAGRRMQSGHGVCGASKAQGGEVCAVGVCGALTSATCLPAIDAAHLPSMSVSWMSQFSPMRLRRPMMLLLILEPALTREPSPTMAFFTVTSAARGEGGGADTHAKVEPQLTTHSAAQAAPNTACRFCRLLGGACCTPLLPVLLCHPVPAAADTRPAQEALTVHDLGGRQEAAHGVDGCILVIE